MKKIISWMFVILITFTFGVITTLIWLKSSQNISSPEKKSSSVNNENLFADLLVLDYCEVRNNPDKYDGKIIRLKAFVHSGTEGEHIYDERCPADESIKTYYDATAAAIYLDKQDYKKVTDVRVKRKLKPWTDPVEIIAVGKFRKNEPTKNDSSYDRNATFHFMIISVDSAIDN